MLLRWSSSYHACILWAALDVARSLSNNLLHSTWLPAVQLFTSSILLLLLMEQLSTCITEKESSALLHFWHNPDCTQQQQQRQQEDTMKSLWLAVACMYVRCGIFCYTFIGKEESTNDKGNGWEFTSPHLVTECSVPLFLLANRATANS